MGKASEANICRGFADLAATLRHGFTTNKVLYVATLSIGFYLLLEGAIPTANIVPKEA